MNIGIIGLQCSGKTTLAKRFDGTIVKFAAPLYAVNEVLGVQKNRSFMQGQSDLIKSNFGRDYFIKEFNKIIKFYPATSSLICDDIRYKLEMEYLKSQGWLLVYIDASETIRRERAAAQGLEFLPDHSSETEIESLRSHCDVYIDNSNINIPTSVA
jgi:dephospho-CoA kinase